MRRYLLIFSLQSENSKICTKGLMKLDIEVRNGKINSLVLKSNLCNREKICHIEDPKLNKSAMNCGMVWGTTITDIGQHKLCSMR